MTKEELEKEAEEYADWFWGASPSMMKALARAYIKGAEPREKRIEELEAIVRNTKAVDESFAKLQLENTELKAQIEKMKCCGNCAKNGHICVAEEIQGKLCGKNKDKWELRR